VLYPRSATGTWTQFSRASTERISIHALTPWLYPAPHLLDEAGYNAIVTGQTERVKSTTHSSNLLSM